jgi:hypothetical protein
MFAFIGALASIVFFLLTAALTVLAFVFWIWMLIDCVKNPGLPSGEKVVWVIVIALTHFLGALIYFFAGRPRGRLGPI